ncbi:hypothetical protein OAE48_01385 [Flavobacteriales bacterium]|nr:hypothetical protein [Flavobacteriales bacterium]
MKNLFALLVLLSFCVGSLKAQDNPSTSTSASKKAELVKVEPEKATGTQAETSERDVKTAQRLEKRPVVEMTDEYIDNQIAEIQKVIDKNEGNEEFNLSGYQKRIKYLESRRPKK